MKLRSFICILQGRNKGILNIERSKGEAVWQHAVADVAGKNWQVQCSGELMQCQAVQGSSILGFRILTLAAEWV